MLVKLKDSWIWQPDLRLLMQYIAFEVADGLVVAANGVILLFQYAAIGQFGTQVAQRVVVIAHGAALALVDGGFADQPVEGVVGQFDAAVAVAGFDQVAAERVVVVAAAAVGFGMPVPVEAAAGLFGQPAEQVAFEAVQLQRSGRVAAVFALFAQLAGFISHPCSSNRTLMPATAQRPSEKPTFRRSLYQPTHQPVMGLDC